MIRNKAWLKETLMLEEKIYKPGIKKYIPYLFSEEQILHRMLFCLRKAEYFRDNHKKIRGMWYRVRTRRLMTRYGINIPFGVCDKGLSIAHIGTIIINYQAVIGENCRIHAGVVIGANGGVLQSLAGMFTLGRGPRYLAKLRLRTA